MTLKLKNSENFCSTFRFMTHLSILNQYSWSYWSITNVNNDILLTLLV